MSARSTLYDQQIETALLEAAGSRGRSFGRLETLCSGDAGAREEHDQTILLCKFCWEYPAQFVDRQMGVE